MRRRAGGPLVNVRQNEGTEGQGDTPEEGRSWLDRETVGLPNRWLLWGGLGALAVFFFMGDE